MATLSLIGYSARSAGADARNRLVRHSGRNAGHDDGVSHGCRLAIAVADTTGPSERNFMTLNGRRCYGPATHPPVPSKWAMSSWGFQSCVVLPHDRPSGGRAT